MKTIIEIIIHQDILNELLKHKKDYDIPDNEYTDFCNSRIKYNCKHCKLYRHSSMYN